MLTNDGFNIQVTFLLKNKGSLRQKMCMYVHDILDTDNILLRSME